MMRRESDLFSAGGIRKEDLLDLGFAAPELMETSLDAIRRLLPDELIGTGFLAELLRVAAVSADPELAIRQFETLLERHPEPAEFCLRVREDRQLPSLARLLGAAPALGAWITNNPDFLPELLAAPLGDLCLRPRFEAARKQILEPPDPREAVLKLRRFRRRESYRIAAFDLLGEDPLEAVLMATSDLADFVLSCLLEILARKWRDAGRDFAIIALGKLGARELNFSSDIDLIYLCSDEADTGSMIRLSRQLTRHLTEGGPEGRLYRTDLRLRPMGSTGEVVYPLGAFRQYFETGADTFDRLAMLKARFVAGNPELGRRFEELAVSFVYRKYLDSAAIDEVRWLKRRSDARLSELAKQENIKLGTGGIREVEFFAQSLQLLYGGRDPGLRTRGTLTVLATLQSGGYVSEADVRRLIDGYRFLRRVENLLQLDSDLQVQSLPQQVRARMRLARLLGFSSIEEFQARLNDLSSEVHAVFKSLFATTQEGELRDLVLNPGLEEEGALEILRQAGIEDGSAVFSGLRSMAEATAYPVSASRMRTLLARILPGLLQHAERSREPAAFLARFDRLSERLGSRAHLYQSLIETPDFAHRLYQALLLGEALSQQLIRYPEVVDLFTEPVPEEWSVRALPAAPDSLAPAEWAVQLRDYKEREELKLGLHIVRQPAEPKLRQALTRMADQILGQVLRHLISQRPALRSSDLTLFGLGKLGGSELTFHSDLDLILVYRTSDPDLAPLFDDIVRDLKRILEGQFSGPSTYQLDFRLRPEGRKSAPATPLSGLESYCRTRLQFWERLAYGRARPVFVQGNPISLERAAGSGRELLTPEGIEQVLHLRHRKQLEDSPSEALFHVKLAPGGLFDLQLAAGLELLRKDLHESRSREALEVLRRENLLTPGRASLIAQALELYQRLETALRLTTGSSCNILAGTARQLDQIAGLCGIHGGNELLEQCRWSSRGVQQWFEEVFEIRPSARSGDQSS